jgi:hypothetical protein
VVLLGSYLFVTILQKSPKRLRNLIMYPDPKDFCRSYVALGGDFLKRKKFLLCLFSCYPTTTCCLASDKPSSSALTMFENFNRMRQGCQIFLGTVSKNREK